jgi:hypothetical protein
MRYSGRFTSSASWRRSLESSLGVFVAGALLFHPVTARADDNPKPYPTCDRSPTDADVSGAKGAFDAGQASFNEADYSRAIDMWEDAYRRDCTAHRLLLNLARAYELNNQKHRAVNALKTYLARNPGSTDESQIQRRIEKLDEQIKAEAPVPTPTPPTTTPPTTTLPPNAATAPPPPETTPPPPPESANTGSRPLAPLFLAGGGGAVAIVGAILYFGAKSDVSNYEKQCPNHVCANDTVKSNANSAGTRVDVSGAVTIVGLAAIAGGLTWYFLSSPSQPSTALAPRPARAGLTPAVAPGYGGVALTGEFF